MKLSIEKNPTEEDITELLTEFTVNFLVNGFSTLVDASRKKLLTSASESEFEMEQSHFLWLVTYFLKFAIQVEIEVDQIG